MPTLTLRDGTSLAWDDAAPPIARPTSDNGPPLDEMVSLAPQAITEPPVPPPEPLTAAAPPAEADVKAALNATPPKWMATLRRFGKVLLAAVVATLGAYQGDFNALIHDPRAAIALAGTAILAAGEKFVRWKE